VCERGYWVGDADVALDAQNEYAALHGGTVFHGSTDALEVPATCRRRFRTDVQVVNRDCLDAAEPLARSGAIPAVLNMANRHNPGGGVHAGAGAQEENLFRCSNLFWSLYQFAPYAGEYGVPSHPAGQSYPIPRESGGIYSPGASVFRSSEATGYAFLAEPIRVAFVTVPAINQPDLTRRQGRAVLTEPMAAATLRKIRAILRISAAHGHTELVLSAFGCGAFCNPPRHVARLFRQALTEREFEGVFQRVVFAVLDDHNAVRPESSEGNLVPFEQELGGTGA
jgi:uncharacterized protein (TIGR02452 family)